MSLSTGVRNSWLVALLAGACLVTVAGVSRAEEPKKEENGSGYVPGDRKAFGLGLSPHAPQTPSLPGGTTTPFAAPDPKDEWKFNFWGYMSAALRVSRGAREAPTSDQFGTTLHAFPRIVDAYGMFSGTNSPQGSWVDLTFEYGNSFVTSHVKITSWKPVRGTDWTALGSQNFLDSAYLDFNVLAKAPLTLKWTVGAFRNTYGGLGQYGTGQYNAQIIGAPFGIGETLTAQYDLSDKYTLHLEHGFMGRLGKTPAGVVPLASNAGANPALPSSWVHHAHVGIARKGDIPLVAGLHYISNFAADERDQLDDPRTYWINEGNRPDPRMNIYGADFRMLDNSYGNFAFAVSYADAKYAALLTGLNFFGAYTGEHVTKRFLGPQGGGSGQMVVAGFEYVLSWGRMFRHEAYLGEYADLTTSVFADVVSIKSQDPDFDGRKMYKFGAEATYRFFPWLAVSGRADHVAPNSKDLEESFYVISPKVVFKTDWLSHEQITLAYTRWFYGDRTHAEFPDNYSRGQLDNEMYALTFGMWW